MQSARTGAGKEQLRLWALEFEQQAVAAERQAKTAMGSEVPQPPADEPAPA